MKVIVISGKARHGKDTTALFLRTLFEENGYRAVIAHYADYLKFVLSTYFRWNGKKDDEGRSLLQYVGTDIVRKRDPDFWARIMTEKLLVFDGDWDAVIIPDCRFPNEITVPKDAGFDVIHIRVDRPGFSNGLTDDQASHPSETALDGIMPESVIVNDGTLIDLAKKVTMWFNDRFFTQTEMKMETE